MKSDAVTTNDCTVYTDHVKTSLQHDQRGDENAHCAFTVTIMEYVLRSGDLCIVIYQIYIQHYATLHSLSLETALHVSGGISIHHQEHTQLYLQHVALVKPLPLPAAIVEVLELQSREETEKEGAPERGQLSSSRHKVHRHCRRGSELPPAAGVKISHKLYLCSLTVLAVTSPADVTS